MVKSEVIEADDENMHNENLEESKHIVSNDDNNQSKVLLESELM